MPTVVLWLNFVTESWTWQGCRHMGAGCPKKIRVGHAHTGNTNRGLKTVTLSNVWWWMCQWLCDVLHSECHCGLWQGSDVIGFLLVKNM